MLCNFNILVLQQEEKQFSLRPIRNDSISWRKMVIELSQMIRFRRIEILP